MNTMDDAQEEKSKGFWEKAQEAFIKVVDVNNDESIDLKDVAAVADNVGNAAKNAVDVVRKNAKEGANQLAGKMELARKEAEKKALCPIFAEDLDSQDFHVPKMIRIAEPDKKHENSEVCQGAIGYEIHSKGVCILNIYPSAIKQFGISLSPGFDEELYYVDPSNCNHYIGLDGYFNHMKIVRVNELQRIAQELGATHFKVTYKEQKKRFAARKADVKGQLKHDMLVNGQVIREGTEEDYDKVEIAAESYYEGHEPVIPVLRYYQNDTQIKALVDARMSNNKLQHMSYTLNCSSSSGIKTKDAIKIDAALNALKLAGNATLTSEAQSEERRCFEYEIDF